MGSDIKRALTRKFGPLPAWAWAIIFGIGVYYYRNRLSNAANTANTTTGQVQSDTTPQDPITLAPGESVYDPNTGALMSAPGDTSGIGGTDNTLADAMNNLAGALGNAEASQPNTGTSSTGHKLPKLRGRGAIRARFGRHKPKPKKGYTAVGLGHGFWEYLPKKSAKRTAKKKAGHDQKPEHQGHGHRSAATTKPQGRSHANGHDQPPTGHNRQNNATGRYQRSRPKHPATQQGTQNQRPEPSHGHQQHHTTHPSPRPSGRHQRRRK